MEDEWRYLVNSRDCYINLAGEVQQNGEIILPYKRLQTRRHRWVDVQVATDIYAYDREEFTRSTTPVLVWHLMVDAWFSNWPDDGELFFVDEDPWNCSADNIRVWSRRSQRMIDVRDDGYLFAFDKRLRGRVECLETGETYSGPAAAAKAIGGTKSGVSLVLSGHLAKHHGFHFRWV